MNDPEVERLKNEQQFAKEHIYPLVRQMERDLYGDRDREIRGLVPIVNQLVQFMDRRWWHGYALVLVVVLQIMILLALGYFART